MVAQFSIVPSGEGHAITAASGQIVACHARTIALARWYAGLLNSGTIAPAPSGDVDCLDGWDAPAAVEAGANTALQKTRGHT